jgi:hypothetical protein
MTDDIRFGLAVWLILFVAFLFMLPSVTFPTSEDYQRLGTLALLSLIGGTYASYRWGLWKLAFGGTVILSTIWYMTHLNGG